MNKLITLEQIQALEPCHSLDRYKIIEPISLTSILERDDVLPRDKIWVVTKFLDDKTNRLFAVWCAREALKLVDNPDPRSIQACDVAERYALGHATEEELSIAADDARAAADAYGWAAYGWSAADEDDMSDAAAWSAARAATAARDTANTNATDAAVWVANRDAAADEAYAAAADESYAAAAVWNSQIKHLIIRITSTEEP